MPLAQLDPLATVALLHHGDCTLLGVTPDLTVYVEEVYGDGWLAQHAVRLDGTIVDSVDEADGARPLDHALALPEALARPRTAWHTMGLNFSGPRHRGLRGPERAAELVRPMAVRDRMALVGQLGLPAAPIWLGLAESYVLAETVLSRPNLFAVCRRLRLAYALDEPQRDADGQEYDYDTAVVYVAHLHDRRHEHDDVLPERTDLLPGPVLRRPMDCIATNGTLIVAEGGDATQPSRVHAWQVTLDTASHEDDDSPVARLYGPSPY